MATLLFLLFMGGGLGLYLTQRHPTVKSIRQGSFELSVWFPPDDSDVIMLPASGESGYLALADETSVNGFQAIRVFKPASTVLFQESKQLLSPSPAYNIRSIWPNGQALRRDGRRGYTSVKLSDSHHSPAPRSLHSYQIASGVQLGPAVLRDNALFYFERVYSKFNPDVIVEHRVHRLTADGRDELIGAFPDAFTFGHAWDEGQLTLAVLLKNGSLMRLALSSQSFKVDEGLDVLGKIALAKTVEASAFYLAQDFAVFRTKDGNLCIDRVGASVPLHKLDLAHVDAAGRPRNFVFRGLQSLWLNSKGKPREAAEFSVNRIVGKERLWAPPDVYGFTHALTLVDEQTVVVADRDYHRINVISYHAEPW